MPRCGHASAVARAGLFRRRYSIATSDRVVAPSLSASLATEIRGGLSPTRARIYSLEAQLQAIHERLGAPAVEDAKRISKVHESIAAVERAQERDRKPLSWRGRAAHITRERQRKRHLDELHERREELLQRVSDPEPVLARAKELLEQRGTLISEHLRLRDQAIEEELASRPPWLTKTLGPEPQDRDLRGC